MGEARRRKLAGTVRTEEETQSYYSRMTTRYEGLGIAGHKARRNKTSAWLKQKVKRK